MNTTRFKSVSVYLFIVLFTSGYLYSQSVQPSNREETLGPENGTLLIIGGSASDMFYHKFMELVGGPEAPIVVIPTAASSNTLSEAFLARFKKRYLDIGFKNVTVLHTRDPKEANSDEFIKPIKTAKGVWFSGGRQWRHADSYLNTKTHDAFNELLDRGGVVAGSSAGATIQGSYLARGDTKRNTIMMGDHEVGLGFLTNVAIDQHLLARNRQFDMFEILDHKPELLGIGIDENTGIIVRHDRFEVIGESYVAMYDNTRWSAERDTVYQLSKGSREYYMLKSGDEYNLKKREVITPKNREYVSLSNDQLQQYVGTYKADDDSIKIEITKVDKGLTMKTNQGEFALLPTSQDRFYFSNSNSFLTFKMNTDGSVAKIVIPNQNMTLSKTSGNN